MNEIIVQDLTGSVLPIVDNQDWYQGLLEECASILTEFSFLSRWARVEGYHTLGKRIMEENNNFERSKIYGKQVIRKLSTHLGISGRTLFYAVAFAKKYPDLTLIPMGKNANWTRIVSEYLPEKSEELDDLPIEPKKKHHCPSCGFDF